jgi:hypothetical protein
VQPEDWAGLLRSEAHGMAGYHFAVPQGPYDLRLILAETHPALTTLQRSFSVGINGHTLATDICPAAIAGGFARPGEVLVAGVAASESGLRLEFSSNANVVGIALHRSTGDGRCRVTTRAWLPPVQVCDPTPPPVTTLRFLGHSGTFYWAIPESVARLVAIHQPQRAIATAGWYAGGKGVRFFAESPAADALLADGAGGWVAIQDSSWGPLEHPDEFETWMPRLIARVRAAGARPVLYAYSGPKRHTPEQRRCIQARYDDMGIRHQVPVVPCAAALALAEESEPGLDLYDADGHHLGIAGGSLFAFCWYRALCGPAAPHLVDHAVLGGRIALPTALATRLAGIADRACAGRGPGILAGIAPASDVHHHLPSQEPTCQSASSSA